MNKGEFVEFIAKHNKCSKTDAESAVKMFVDGVTGALKAGHEVLLVGFGSFLVRDVPARKGHNPKTGEELMVKGYRQPKFKIGKNLKDACN